MADNLVFAYGSNMNRSDLRSWLESNGHDSSLVLDCSPARLEGFDFVWNYFSQGRGGGTANLERKEGSTIWGILIQIDAHLLPAFDRKEGHPFFYSRGERPVPVTKVSDGKTLPAWVYIACANKGGRRDVWPSREYKRIVLEAAIFWKFPQEYIARIEAWTTQ